MDALSLDRFELRRQILALIHTDFSILAPNGDVALYGRKKGFKLKEDVRLFTDEQREREWLSIQARAVIDFSASYDVTAPDGTRVGVLQRKGVRSILRDEWHILDRFERPLAIVQEDSAGMALLRRFLSNLIPQSFHITAGEAVVGEVKQNFNPIHLRLSVDLSADTRGLLDRRLAIAAVALLGTIEKRQG